jgi:hypothetical protein
MCFGSGFETGACDIDWRVSRVIWEGKRGGGYGHGADVQ